MDAPTPKDIVANHLSGLQQRRERLVSSIAHLEKCIAELDIKIEGIKELIPALDSASFVTPDNTPAKQDESPNGVRKVGPTKAVLDYIGQHPGTDPTAVVKALADVIATESTDPKKVLYNTLWQLEKNRRLINRSGGLHIAIDTEERNTGAGETVG